MRAGDTLGFVVAVGIGVQNYRDTDLERTFRATFVLVAGTGALWMGLVTVEWLGIQGALVDSLSTSLQAIVVGVFAIGSIGTIAVVQDLKDSRRETERQRIEAEQAREEAEQLNAHLQRKASAFSASMSRAADGDLTQRMNPESRSDAMSEIAEAFNDMMDELEGTFARIRTFADEVAASSEEVTGNRAPGLAQPRPTAAARSTTSVRKTALSPNSSHRTSVIPFDGQNLVVVVTPPYQFGTRSLAELLVSRSHRIRRSTAQTTNTHIGSPGQGRPCRLPPTSVPRPAGPTSDGCSC